VQNVTDRAAPRDIVQTQSERILSTLNWLRAAVLGANDGIVSTAAIIFGVAGANANHSTIMLAGIASVSAGALSMAAGEYVSVATQRDLERGELARQRASLKRDPDGELQALAALFEQRGVEPRLASEVARQMSEKDALAVHARAQLGIDPESVTNPLTAALASMFSFTLGGLVPVLSILLSPQGLEVAIAGGAVVAAMVTTGAISARLGRMPALPSVARNVVGGLIAMAVTFGVGSLAGGQF
jgi:VIT1/CCC1 family predicted Fe2+/Mn2+ transporter